ncbi:cytochrome c oxidase subunit II [Conexibacter sp. JD483]|uniref:cytochrome c oxidase subunit II n=1 Tax=unclassified Conexibacter TaxID=2627773 RepID=UPI00271D2806|nr:MULTISPECIES: cytochrome c oxidase subunit II [unclassified Conexibacter]MDO8187531.1 cytochrome c oxidase subunit II [Conexibacter sp. CPCC 205706]MDO8199226.1 cytochrome c oxidase subunit II [Conexibacter sp. CPCC 205762]MDR9369569.1 cytochrome c oxidase subunit II [Conexibacter sp. JD483]
MRPETASIRRRAVAALLLATIGSLVFASGAFADFLTPESGGSPNADQIDSLYKIVLYIAIVVFIVVEGALFYSIWRFRAKKGAVAAQIHGNTRLEISWTVGAALILVALAAVTFSKLSSIQDPPNSGKDGLQLADGVLTASTDMPKPPNGKSLTICVTGRQYIWRYTYGAECQRNAFGLVYSYEEMVVPANTTVVLDIQATDVIHSWWIPKLGGKFDAVPGYRNYTWFKAPKAGETYRGQCAELCGRNHADMTARVRVVTPQAYEAWVDQQRSDIADADREVQQLREQLTRDGDLN